MPEVVVKVADNFSEFKEAYQLVYQQYLERGYLAEGEEDVLNNDCGSTIIAKINSRIVGTLTVAGDVDNCLKMEEVYPDEIRTLRNGKRNIAEIRWLSIDSNDRNVFFALTKFLFQHSIYHNYDDLVMVVHPRHYKFYWFAFRAYPIGPLRPCSYAGGHPGLCCRINLHHIKQNMTEKIRRKHYDDLEKPEHYK